jgi:hypothetical protein
MKFGEDKDKDKDSAIRILAYYSPTGYQEFESPRFRDNQHMKVVRLSAVDTSRLYPTGNIPGTNFF